MELRCVQFNAQTDGWLTRDTTKKEVDSYLADTAVNLESLSAYPHVRQLYISLNTGLSSSAAVERLFSLGGRVFSPLRARLSSGHFENC